MDEHQAPDEVVEAGPWAFTVVKWYSYIFSACFLLYGGVNIILGVLDRDYTKTPESMLFLVIGIVLAAVSVGYRDRRRWGWFGLLAINGLVVILAAIGFRDTLNLILLLLSMSALGLLLLPKTRAEIG